MTQDTGSLSRSGSNEFNPRMSACENPQNTSTKTLQFEDSVSKVAKGYFQDLSETASSLIQDLSEGLEDPPPKHYSEHSYQNSFMEPTGSDNNISYKDMHMTNKTSSLFGSASANFVYGKFLGGKGLCEGPFMSLYRPSLEKKSENALAKMQLEELSKMSPYILQQKNDLCSSSNALFAFSDVFIEIFYHLVTRIRFMSNGEEFLKDVQNKEENFINYPNKTDTFFLPISFVVAKRMIEWERNKNFIIFCVALTIPELNWLIQDTANANLSEIANQARRFISNEENQNGLKQIRLCNLDNSKITELPPQIGQLISLQKLNLGGNALAFLPPEIGNLTSLQELYLNQNKLRILPPQIGNLVSLRELVLWKNELTFLPPEIGNLTNLEELYLNDNKLTTLPQQIGRLTLLKILNLGKNLIKIFPQEIISLPNLQKLDLSENQLTCIPPEICLLTFLRKLKLENNPLTFLPKEIDFFHDLKEKPLAYLPRIYKKPPTSRSGSRLNSLGTTISRCLLKKKFN